MEEAVEEQEEANEEEEEQEVAVGGGGAAPAPASAAPSCPAAHRSMRATWRPRSAATVASGRRNWRTARSPTTGRCSRRSMAAWRAVWRGAAARAPPKAPPLRPAHFIPTRTEPLRRAGHEQRRLRWRHIRQTWVSGTHRKDAR